MAPTELKIKGKTCFSHLSSIDTDEDLSKTWRLMTKVKDALEYGRRLENLSWRLWFMHHLIVYDQKRSKKCFRKLSTATTKKLETEKSTALDMLDTPNFKSKSSDSSFLEKKGKKKARKHGSNAAKRPDAKKPKYASRQCSMPSSETFVKMDTSQMDIDDKGALSVQIPSSASTESLTMSPTHNDMVMIQGSPESTSTISTNDDPNDMQLTEPVGLNDIYTVFNEDFLRGSFTDEHAFVLHRYTTDQEETQSVILQDSYVGYGSDFHSDLPSIGVSLNQLLRSVYNNYSSDSSEPTSPSEMDLINSQGYVQSDAQTNPGLQYHHHLTEQMVASPSNAVYVPRSTSTPTIDTDLANNLMNVLGTPMNTPVTDIPSLGSGMMYMNQYQSEQSTVQPISISQRQTNSTGNNQASARQNPENRVKKAHSGGEQQCFNCGVTSTPLWRRSANDELLCNACGLYLKLHKMDRPKTMKPHIVRKDARDDEASQPVCTNCGTMTTPLWRRDEEGQTLCNACGLYFKLHHEKRPLSMKTDIIKKRQRYENGQNPNRRTAKKQRDSITQQVSSPRSTSPTEAQTQTIYPSIGVTTSPNPSPIGITTSPNPSSARTSTSSMNVASKVSPISATSI
ncbi:5019_t:CDS:2 [Paraglomus occultum]|uniref:5019_t:CDS:1 n=1 Tax=Paraglomus occultum TaxID=144539 RepID=A0A9N9FLZ9_9GLOM|nr:5019_t:CDS:2 [Paraglomus occultum]